MAIIKKTRNNRCWQRCGANGAFTHCWWQCKLVQPLWKTVKKALKLVLSYNLEIPLLGVSVKETKSLFQKISVLPCSVALFSISQDMETA